MTMRVPDAAFALRLRLGRADSLLNDLPHAFQGQSRQLTDIQPCELHAQGLGPDVCHDRVGIQCSRDTATTRFFIVALSVLAKVLSTYCLALVNVP